MCRSIKQLRVPEGPPTPEEVRAASLQFVRKVSGFRKPSRVNTEAFEAAVEEIAGSVEDLLGHLVVPAGRARVENLERSAAQL